MNPIISVIVPIYNRELYLEKCIESIVSQTYSNLEIILVDDGSPDNCPAICDEWAKKDSRIKVVHKENGGVASARNAGLSAATGDYVAFVDGDDFIAPEMYSVLTQYLSEDIELVLCRFIHYRDNSEECNGTFNVNEGLYSSDEIINYLYNKQNSEWVSVCNKLIKKELFEGLSFPEGRVFEDWAIVPFLYYRSKKIFFTNQKLYYYVVHNENSIVSSHSLKRYYDCVLNDYDQFIFFEQNNCKDYNDSIKFIIRADFRKMCKHYSISKKNKSMLKNAFKICNKLCGIKNARLEILFYYLRVLICLRNRVENGKN